jgi:hypothetical protein
MLGTAAISFLNIFDPGLVESPDAEATDRKEL